MRPVSPLNPCETTQVRSTPLFEGLSDEAFRTLIADARVADYPDRVLLFSRGDPADRFFVVLAGRVRLFVLTLEGKESVIEFIAPVTTFAEAAIFGAGKLPVNAEVAAGTRLVHIPARPLLRQIHDDPKTARRILDSLARWQRHLLSRVVEFKALTPSQRLATALLTLTEVAVGPADIRLAVSKQGLASQIGVTPESLSRLIQRLRRHGVSVQGRRISIADVTVLRDLSATEGGDGPAA
jgi:CRP-like cAMP-binding protein